MNYIEALEKRRSIYAIGNEQMISDEELKKMITSVIEATPSAYDSRSQKVALLLGKQHQVFWNLVMEALKKIVSEKQFPKTEKKINNFAKGYGTILLFEDTAITNGLIEEFPLYKDNFALWAHHQAGMIQSNIWVALSTVGYGASLQHYTELIEEKVKSTFEIPDSWKLLAQMPFGNVLQQPDPKEITPISERFIIRS